MALEVLLVYYVFTVWGKKWHLEAVAMNFRSKASEEEEEEEEVSEGDLPEI